MLSRYWIFHLCENTYSFAGLVYKAYEEKPCREQKAYVTDLKMESIKKSSKNLNYIKNSAFRQVQSTYTTTSTITKETLIIRHTGNVVILSEAELLKLETR